MLVELTATIAQVTEERRNLHVLVAMKREVILGGVNASCSSALKRKASNIVASVVTSHATYP